jgi:outer membrane protein
VSVLKVIRAGAMVLSLAAAAAVQAQTASNAKVGIVNMGQAIFATAEGKQAMAQLETEFAPREKQMEEISKRVNEFRQQLSANQANVSDEQRAKAQVQGQRLTEQLNRKQTEYQQDVKTAQSEAADRIGRKMMEVLDRYARQNGFAAVFDASAGDSMVLLASPQIDLTQEMVKLYDQAYPAKASAVATKPAASTAKPAITPTKKP